MDLNVVADALFKAQDNAKGIAPVVDMMPDMTLEDAYNIQIINIKKRVGQGRKIIGKKIGLTSLAMQRLLKVDEPDYGNLLDDMLHYSGETLDISKMIQPKVEAELAFILNKDLDGPDVTPVDVYNAVSCVMPSLEIVDSRVSDWKITLRDTIADNASSGALVLGHSVFDIRDFDLLNIGMYLMKNGELYNSGAGIEVMGNPVLAVAWLANKLHSFDMNLKAGDIVLSGALTAAAEAKRGDEFTAYFDGMGSVSVQF